MTGILLIAIVGLWVWCSFKLSRWIAARVVAARVRTAVTIAIFTSLLLLAVVDEVVGGFQFRALCADHASEFRVRVPNPEGRTTKVTIDPSNERLRGTAIPVLHSHFQYHDVATGELVVEFDEYIAKGGVLVRSLGISESNSPLTIGSPGCSPQRGKNVRLRLKFNVIN